ncbi:coiled-coil domain-containing protein 180 isoform X2 [Lates calcarifer]|uniref:Coiled-coil domain-containing protein 180 isoform X2 n=1 Tax=Lates calcarifer TaxID=8187 RepID=A0AAJ8B2Z7_LATCA|nr:coiled-coil domain-containing protein 180 isoform X2 [Lates calcarifer]
MCESREVPSGKVYRQLFDAQAQLSRSLLAGQTDCQSAEDNNTHCSTSRLLCSSSSREQQQVDDDDDDIDDVIRLPDTVVVDRLSSDIIERLTMKKLEKHKEAMKRFDTELMQLTQVCETQVRTISQELLSFLQEVDLKLDTLRDRMEQMEHLDLQEVCGLWEQVEKEVKLKKTRIMELTHRLTESEAQRTDEIRAVLKKYCYLLEKISFLLPPDVHRLIHTEATMLNQSLLANRRSAARLLLLLQEENLQQESLLRLHWEDCLSRWRRSRVNKVIDRFRSLCSRDEDQQLISVQQMKQTQRDLTEQRQDLINRISSLVPPTCSTALVSDWFNQLSAVNQQIDSVHADSLHQLRCCYEQVWQNGLSEVELCKEALSALQLSEEEVNDIVSSQLLPLIGRNQRQDEERLAALDVCSDSVSRHARSLSRCVFVVMRAAALLWETHNCRLQSREEEVQRHLDDLRHSQQRHLQRKKVRLDDLLGGLRQESSEDALKTSLDRAVLYLQDVKHSCRQCVSDQWEALDRLPSLLLEELLSYSSSLSSFYRLGHTYTPSPEELQNLHLSPTNTTDPETDVEGETQRPEEVKENRPISCQSGTDPAQPRQDWLTESESSLLDLCDISSSVEFTSLRGVVYTGPAFRCPTPNLQQETHLTLFPVELLTRALSRTRTLFLDHLERSFPDVLGLAVAMVTDRKEAACSEQELQLLQLNPQHIQTHIYQPRLAELQLHRQRVDVHCEEVLDVLTSCRTELQELQTSISRRNQEFTVTLSNMEDNVLTVDSSRRLEAVSSTLQDCLDQHIKHTQRYQASYRQMVQTRLEEVRHRTTQLLNSFRLFSEGGDFAPQEVKMFQRRLKDETRQISVTEESICSELEAFESKSLQQVREVSGRFEEKLNFLKSEVKFMEKIQKMISSSQVHIKAEAASSNQQQSVISSWLKEVKNMMENTQVSPDQVCCFLSSVSEDLRRRSQYLDLDPALQVGLAPSARPQSRKQVQSGPPPGLLQPSRTGVDLLDDPVVGVIRSLNRFSLIQEGSAGPAETEERERTAAGQSPVQRPHRSTESVLRGCRSIRTERRFQIFGPKPETDQNPQSFLSSVNSVLWRTNDVLLLAAEEFYRSERLGRFQLLPDSLDQWADSTQQRLLGYQEQARRFLSTSREDLVDQLSVFQDLVCSASSVLISNHERRQRAELMEEVVNVGELRASLRDDELQTLISREELRQQHLHSATCCSHLELQECVRARGEEFVTSLASLTEKLLHQLDDLLTPTETEETIVTMETGAEPGTCTGRRTWPGVSYLSSADPPSSATTATITTSRCTLGHLTVIEQRDTAVKRFEQLIRSELLRSNSDKRRQLREIQSWNTHWRQQIHTLTHTH